MSETSLRDRLMSRLRASAVVTVAGERVTVLELPLPRRLAFRADLRAAADDPARQATLTAELVAECTADPDTGGPVWSAEDVAWLAGQGAAVDTLVTHILRVSGFGAEAVDEAEKN